MDKRWILALLCAATAGAPVGAGAQGIRGIIKKKAAEATGTAKPPPKPEGQPQNPYNDDVLELTAPVMKGFMNGIRIERSLVGELADELAAFKKPDDYSRCTAQVATSEEGGKAMKHLLDLPEGASAEDQQRAIAKMNAEMKLVLDKRCGPNAREEWPLKKRQERVAAILVKAAAATGDVKASGAGSALPMDTPGLAAPDEAIDWPLLLDAAMTLRQYNISWERAENYCRLLNLGAIHPLQPVIHPADKGKEFWIYSETEARAIEPLCPEIVKTRADINAMLARMYVDDLRQGIKD